MSLPNQVAEVLHAWAKVSMRRSMRDFERFAREACISMPHFSMLIRLYHQETSTVSEIGNHLSITNPAASQMVQRLVEGGMLERTEHPTDRRVKQIALTKKGRTLIEEGIAIRRRWLEELANELSEEKQEALVEALSHLLSAVERLG